MDLKFDDKGNLKPYGKNSLDLNEFRKLFVDPFDSDSSRHEIYKNFERYIGEFKMEISERFKILVNGSFVTDRMNPRDLDIVTLLDHGTAEKYKDILESKFLNRTSLKEFKIDAYIVRILPKDHNRYSITASDLLYW